MDIIIHVHSSSFNPFEESKVQKQELKSKIRLLYHGLPYYTYFQTNYTSQLTIFIQNYNN